MAKSQEIRPGPSLARRATVPADSQNHAKPFSRARVRGVSANGASRLWRSKVLSADAVDRAGHSGSGLSFVSGANGKTSSPTRKNAHIVTPV